jgi:hypothetical protein
METKLNDGLQWFSFLVNIPQNNLHRHLRVPQKSANHDMTNILRRAVYIFSMDDKKIF